MDGGNWLSTARTAEGVATVTPPSSDESLRPQALVIACGALGREVMELKRATGWAELTVTCLPAKWHNTPEKIAPAVAAKIRGARGRFSRVFVLYGDCGTGGELDRVLEGTGVERIPGPHCYQFFMGTPEFTALTDEEPGCFFLTDYLVRHFDRLIISGLGLDRFPQLLETYFGNYTKLVHIAQIEDADLRARAEKAAARLGLDFEYRFRGMGELGRFVEAAAIGADPVAAIEGDTESEGAV